jgi:hypothetical protein
MATTTEPGWDNRPEPARDRWGRYLIDIGTGKTAKPTPHTRVTTIAATLSDERNLTLWKQRTQLVGLARRPDLIQLAATTDPDNRRTLDQIAADALDAGDTKKAAAHGTSLHSWTERADRGENTTTPLAPAAHIAAYLDGLDRHGIQIDRRYIETICVNPTEQLGEPIAGTCDRIVNIDGTAYIADLKTGGYHDWMKYAIQLACYANAATSYDPQARKHTPFPAVNLDRAYVLCLPQADTEPVMRVVAVDIRQGWDLAKIACQVRQARKTTNRLAADLPATYPTRTDIQTQIDQIKRHCGTHATAILRAWWPPHIPTLRQSDTHTPDDLRAIGRALTQAAATTEVPF